MFDPLSPTRADRLTFPEVLRLNEAVGSVDRLLVQGGAGPEMGTYERWILIRLKAMLLLGFWAGLNCTQLSSLKLVRLPLVRDELEVRLDGETLYCPRLLKLCPFQAVQAWMDETGATMGPLFRRMGRQRGGGVYLRHLALHPAGICSMLNSVWSGTEGAGSACASDALDREHGWQSVDRRRLMALSEFVGVDVSGMAR